MTSSLFLSIIITILVLSYALEQFAQYLNLRYHPEELPTELEGIYDQEEYDKSNDYHRATTNFSFLTSSVSLIIFILVLLTGLLCRVDGWLANFITQPWLRGVVFLIVMFIINDILTIPFQWFKTFTIEERFGFNKTTPKLFFVDKFKGWVLTSLIGGVLIAALLLLVQFLGQNFWLYFWAIMTAFSLFMAMFFTDLLLPLFNKLNPLDEGELKTAITDYAIQEDFEIKNTLVMDGSKRSTKANAFFSGLGKQKKIVLYDTLVDTMDTEEIVAVMAHEVGHNKKRHIPLMMTMSIVQIGIILFLLSRMIFSVELSQALGSTQAVAAPHLNLIAFSLLFTPISLAIGFFTNWLSRKFEFEADAFASHTASKAGMANALKKLATKNLSNMVPHPFYVALHYDHPPVMERLKAIEKL